MKWTFVSMHANRNENQIGSNINDKWLQFVAGE